MVDIQKADPQARRKAVLTLLAGALVGAGLFFLLEFFIGNANLWIESNAMLLIQHHYLSFLIMLLLVSPIIWLCIYLIRFAEKVINTQRFPPPATPVIRDVRVLEGRQAVVRGRLVQALCWIIVLASALIPLLVWYIFYSVSCMQ